MSQRHNDREKKRAEYFARKGDSQCVYSAGCGRPAERSVYCEKHRVVNVRLTAEYKKRKRREGKYLR